MFALGECYEDVWTSSDGGGSTEAEPGGKGAEGVVFSKKRPESDGEPRGTRREERRPSRTRPVSQPAYTASPPSLPPRTTSRTLPALPHLFPPLPYLFNSSRAPKPSQSHLFPPFFFLCVFAPSPPLRGLRQPDTHISRHRSYVVMSAPCLRSRQTGSINIGAATRAAHLTICTCGRECKCQVRSVFPCALSRPSVLLIRGN